MSYNPNKGNILSEVNSTNVLLGSGGTFTGEWENILDYSTIAVAVLTGNATDGTLYFDISMDGGTTMISVPRPISDTTLNLPKLLKRVESHIRIRYVNGTTAQTGFFRIQTSYLNGSDLSLAYTVSDTVNAENDVTLTKAVIAGELLDGNLEPTSLYEDVSLLNNGALKTAIPPTLLFFKSRPTDPTIPSGAPVTIDPVLNVEANVLDSGWLPASGYGGGSLVHILANVGLSAFVMNSSDTLGSNIEGDTTPVLISEANTPVNIGSPFFNKYVRIVIVNTSGSTATEYSVSIKGNQSAAPPVFTSLEQQIFGFFPAPINRSVQVGKDPTGFYRNIASNEAGALLVGDFGTEVARGLYDGYEINVKIGRNPETNTGSAPEDCWNGGDTYTGFNAVQNENIAVFSSSASDTGSLVSSGTSTDGSQITLIDSGATFVSDGVDIGDVVINDTKGCHGIISSVDSETQVTVHQMKCEKDNSVSNESGDSYRIATSSGTGAAVILVSNLLNEDYERQVNRYAILNGTTPVILTGDYMRCDEAKVIISGSNQVNVGNITVRQQTTTANVFVFLPLTGKSLVGAVTVPSGKNMIIKKIDLSIVRDNGSLGSANLSLFVREVGESWVSLRTYDVQTGAKAGGADLGGLILPPKTDVKIRILSVSDNGTATDGEFEYFLIDA